MLTCVCLCFSGSFAQLPHPGSSTEVHPPSHGNDGVADLTQALPEPDAMPLQRINDASARALPTEQVESSGPPEPALLPGLLDLEDFLMDVYLECDGRFPATM